MVKQKHWKFVLSNALTWLVSCYLTANMIGLSAQEVRKFLRNFFKWLRKCSVIDKTVRNVSIGTTVICTDILYCNIRKLWVVKRRISSTSWTCFRVVQTYWRDLSNVTISRFKLIDYYMSTCMFDPPIVYVWNVNKREKQFGFCGCLQMVVKFWLVNTCFKNFWKNAIC